MHQGSNFVESVNAVCWNQAYKWSYFMSVQCVNVPMLVAKIYSQTDIFLELRLQRSKHGSNCARSSEPQDMLGLGLFSTPEAIVDGKSHQKIHCKTTRNFFATSSEKERLACCPSCKIWLVMWYNTWLSDLSASRILFPRIGAWTNVVFLLLNPG